MNKKAWEIIVIVWFIMFGVLIGVSRYGGTSTGGEFMIALLLWFDVFTRYIDRMRDE